MFDKPCSRGNCRHIKLLHMHLYLPVHLRSPKWDRVVPQDVSS